MGNRFVKSIEKKKFYRDANKLYGWATSQIIPHSKVKFDKNVTLEDVINTLDD